MASRGEREHDGDHEMEDTTKYAEDTVSMGGEHLTCSPHGKCCAKGSAQPTQAKVTNKVSRGISKEDAEQGHETRRPSDFYSQDWCPPLWLEKLSSQEEEVASESR